MKLIEILYPVGLSRNDCRFIVQRVFDSYKIPSPVNSLEVGTVNWISYEADYWNVHPALILATMMMEQFSIYENGKLNPPQPLKPWACEALCGIVEQNNPGTARPDLLGIARQIYQTARGYAWSLNQTPTAMFGRTSGWNQTWPRYTPGIVKSLYDKDRPSYPCKDAVEYSLLCHCPNYGRLKDAQEKWNIFIPFFQG